MALLFTPVASQKTSYHHGSSRCGQSAQDLPTSIPSTTHSSPVVIPSKRLTRVKSHHMSTGSGSRTPKRHQTLRRSSSNASNDNRPLPTSVTSILEATAIPLPKRNQTTRGSRRLPRGKIHGDDFSKMLMDGVEEDHLMGGSGNSALDLLLSPPEEIERSSMSDCDMETTSFSGRSLSSDSTPSLDHDLGSPPSLLSPSSPSSQRSPLERKYRRVSLSEDCAYNHPLLDTDSSESELDTKPLADTVSPQTVSRSFPRFGSTFKSNLTASLRVIKSAAQTVSAFTTPSVQPDDFLTRSLFTINPELTDDRRPPPMDEPPSPALRRYFNPIIVSPAEMHIYNERPHEAVDASRNCPVSIQMQTYNRSGSRKSRKHGFHLAGSGGRGRGQCCPFDPEISPISRQREPRENSDFLRVVVLEMNMRRRGKLRDDIPPRARVWLPPRQNSQPRLPYDDYFYEDEEDENSVPSRWIGVTA